MASSISDLIYQQALAKGVPPAIALAVAQQESGFNQNAVGTSGEIGVFQIMPATADMLGVNPSDLAENISGGISFLAQLFQRYGNWTSALSAYNSGSPTRSLSYANSVLAIAGSTSGPTSPPMIASGISSDGVQFSASDVFGSIVGVSPNVLIIGGLLAAGLLAWWMAD